MREAVELNFLTRIDALTKEQKIRRTLILLLIFPQNRIESAFRYTQVSPDEDRRGLQGRNTGC